MGRPSSRRMERMAAAEARRWRCCGAAERPYRAVRARRRAGQPRPAREATAAGRGAAARARGTGGQRGIMKIPKCPKP
jgi:hypothetical protein